MFNFYSGPTTCGKPEQPPNSTLISTDFNVNSRIEYVCDEGHLLVGPAKRSCLPTGFYSEFPPVCRCKLVKVLLFETDCIFCYRFGVWNAGRYSQWPVNICQRDTSVQVDHQVRVWCGPRARRKIATHMRRGPEMEWSSTQMWTCLLWWASANKVTIMKQICLTLVFN